MIKKILVVDDEVQNVKALKRLIENAGYKVISAQNGKEALSKLKRSKVDLILLDYFMPEMDGGKVCMELARDKELKSIPIIFVTVAQYGEPGVDILRKARVKDYIQKPYDNKDMLNRIAKILGKEA